MAAPSFDGRAIKPAGIELEGERGPLSRAAHREFQDEAFAAGFFAPRAERRTTATCWRGQVGVLEGQRQYRTLVPIGRKPGTAPGEAVLPVTELTDVALHPRQ